MGEEKKTTYDNGILLNLKKSFKYAKGARLMLFLYIIFGALLAFIGVIAPLLSAKELLYVTDGTFKKLVIIALCVFAVEISRNICRALSRITSRLFAREVMKRIQIDMAGEILKIKTADLDKKSSGVFISRLNTDSGKISDIFLKLNYDITDLISSIGVLVAIFFINKIVFCYFLVVVFIIFLVKRKRIITYFIRDKKFRELREKVTGLTGELVRGVRDVKVLYAGKSFMKEIDERITEVNQERYKMDMVSIKYDLVAGSLQDLFDLLLILLCIYLFKQDGLSIANFVIIYMYRNRVMNFLTIVTDVMESLKDFNLSANRVFEILDGAVYRKETFGTRHIDKIKGDFEFKDVSFSYDDKQQVLDNISFKIKPNETVAFVGKSGVGKSTIFSLLAKMYDVDSGHIYIDDIDINELDEESIRNNLTIITQAPYIFNMSIKDNLRIVTDHLTNKEMKEACKMAKLDKFIESLPDKYDTIVGEGGLTLSGGQKQRLAIARAFVQKTKIILFDEATSALDNETQKGIQDAINNMKNKYTILIIAHRLSTVINADRILFVNDGKIVAEGTHRQLLRKSKEYKELYDLELKKKEDN
jgi:ABC-type multidrug transport system fused ATPase/permease subunit